MMFFGIASPMPLPAYSSPCMQALKNLEHPLLEFRFDAYPIILYRGNPPWLILSLIRRPGRHVNNRTAVSTELHGIAKQILKHLGGCTGSAIT
jgi:hypothetical protein